MGPSDIQRTVNHFESIYLTDIRQKLSTFEKEKTFKVEYILRKSVVIIL